jgi:hypothetical protein
MLFLFGLSGGLGFQLWDSSFLQCWLWRTPFLGGCGTMYSSRSLLLTDYIGINTRRQILSHSLFFPSFYNCVWIRYRFHAAQAKQTNCKEHLWLLQELAE